MTDNPVVDQRIEPISAVKRLVGAVGLLGLIGILGSLVSNGIVFAIWGLNFFQIAAPSDLLLSGSYLIFSVLILSALVAIAATLNSVLLFFGHKFGKTGNKSGALHHDAFPIIVIFLSIIVLFFAIFKIDFLRESVEPLFIDDPASVERWPVFILMCEIMLITLVLHILWAEHGTEILSRAQNQLKDIRVLSVGIAICGLANLVIFSFIAKPDWTIEGLDGHCDHSAVAIWIGSEMIVARCDDLTSPIVDTEQFFMTPKDELRFVGITSSNA